MLLVRPPKRRRRRGIRRAASKSQISAAGLAFLKCATSPADMTVDSFSGIPDQYDGPIVSKRHTYVGAMPTFTAGTDGYIVVAPVPGVSYFYGERAAGTTGAITFTPVFYSDNATLFPAGAEASVVNNFRYASSVVELIPTVNAMSWSGSIQVFKGQCKTEFVPGAAANYYEWSGWDVINSSKPTTVLPFNHGCYSPTRCAEADYPFTQVLQAVPYNKVNPVGATVTITSTPNFVGLGCEEVVVIKLPSYAVANTATIRTWACVEYQVSSTSILYEYSHMSPPWDPLAMQLLNRFFKEHPSAVPFYDNDSFWRTFLSWAKTITGALKVIPGPVGEAAGIGESIANLVGDLTL